jgi:FAD:protein FMN transferase
LVAKDRYINLPLSMNQAEGNMGKILKPTVLIVITVVLLFMGIKIFNAHRFHLESRTRFMMDTYVSIHAIGPEKISIPAMQKAFDRMQEIDVKFNHLNPESPIYTFNRDEIPISDREIIDLVKKSLDVSEKSGGSFDITILPLGELWGFYGDDKPHVPESEDIRENLRYVGFDKIKLENEMLIKTQEKIRIDLGGIAKGYALGEAVRVLKEEGVKSALVDAGGDIYALGRRGNKLWKVGIKDPHSDGLLGYLEVEDMAVVGSGDYERFFKENGKKYHHIFNPKTGYPSEGLSGITLIHPDPLIADAWNTALFVMGPKKAIEMVEKMPDMETILVTTTGEVSCSSGLKDVLKVISNNQ